ncbi:MAG TPA: hypothetical protein VMU94_21980 [Streptosporangiaceae bacterium]|nr:hypothetical protein [Streptosporangiaceae bacterium]
MQLRHRRRWRLRLRAEPLHDQPHRQDHLLHANGEVEHYLRAGEQSDGLEEDQQALAGFMDAVVIVGPAEYRRRPDDTSGALRTLPFGPYSQGLVTFLICPPEELDLVVRIRWLSN